MSNKNDNTIKVEKYKILYLEEFILREDLKF
jgi:hypothetical protein